MKRHSTNRGKTGFMFLAIYASLSASSAIQAIASGAITITGNEIGISARGSTTSLETSIAPIAIDIASEKSISSRIAGITDLNGSIREGGIFQAGDSPIAEERAIAGTIECAIAACRIRMPFDDLIITGDKAIAARENAIAADGIILITGTFCGEPGYIIRGLKGWIIADAIGIASGSSISL